MSKIQVSNSHRLIVRRIPNVCFFFFTEATYSNGLETISRSSAMVREGEEASPLRGALVVISDEEFLKGEKSSSGLSQNSRSERAATLNSLLRLSSYVSRCDVGLSVRGICRARLNGIRCFSLRVSGIAGGALKGSEDAHRNVDIS